MLSVIEGKVMLFGLVLSVSTAGAQGVIWPVSCGSGGAGTMCSGEPGHKQPLGIKTCCGPLKP